MKEPDYFHFEWPDENYMDLRTIKNRYREIEPKKQDIHKENFIIHFLSTDDTLRKIKYGNKRTFSRNTKELPLLSKFNISNYKRNSILLNNNYNSNIFINSNENDIINSLLNKLDKNKNFKETSRFRLPRLHHIRNMPSPIKIKQESSHSIEFSNDNYRNFGNEESLSDLKIAKEKRFDSGNNSKNLLDNSSSIFKATNCKMNSFKKTQFYLNDDFKTIKKDRKEKSHCFSPLLGKNLTGLFKTINDREEKSIKKGVYITNGVNKINERKINIESYDVSQKDKYKLELIKLKDKKFQLINAFKNIGKVNSVKEIDDVLFKKDNQFFPLKRYEKKLHKKGLKKIKKYENNLSMQ